MLVKCYTCNKNMSPGDVKKIFSETFELKSVPLEYLPIVFMIIFDAEKFCCKKTLMDFIRDDFKLIYNKSKQAIEKISRTEDPKYDIYYIKQVVDLLNRK